MDMIRVLVVEDMDSLRKRYVRILNNAEGIEVVGAAENGYEGTLLAALHKPDIVLMDIEMGTKDAGLIAAREILRSLPACKIIILTVHQSDLLLYSAFEEGVSNYILKNVSAGELISCVKKTYKNTITMKSDISQKILGEFQRMRERESEFKCVLEVVMQLTPTQLRIVYLLWLGKSRDEICDYYCIEPNSLKSHIHNILSKLHLKNVKALMAFVDHIRLFDFIKGSED